MALAMLCLWITALVGITMMAERTRLRRGAHHDISIFEGAVSHEAPQATVRSRPNGRKKAEPRIKSGVTCSLLAGVPYHATWPARKRKWVEGLSPSPPEAFFLSPHGQKTALACAHARECLLCLFPNFS
jgi:hypothetical protein